MTTRPIPANEGSRSQKVPKSAILAGAALTLPFAANADIIFNPTQVTISSTNSTDETYNLSFDNPSVTDFLFTASFSGDGLPAPFDSVTPQGNNGYVGGSFDPIYAQPLAAGTLIGPSSSFSTSSNGFGKLQKKGKTWPNSATQFAYLGVEFYIGSDLHYGWVNVSASDGAVITINGFAYQSAANTPISAGAVPEPSALPLLALGAAGLAAFRSRRKQAA